MLEHCCEDLIAFILLLGDYFWITNITLTKVFDGAPSLQRTHFRCSTAQWWEGLYPSRLRLALGIMNVCVYNCSKMRLLVMNWLVLLNYAQNYSTVQAS